MGLISTEVKIRLNGRNLKYWEDKGYEIPRKLDSHNKMSFSKKDGSILVKVLDLPRYSHVNVEVQCDYCKKNILIPYDRYTKSNHDGKYYCGTCAPTVLISGENHYAWVENKSTDQEERKREYKQYFAFIKRVLARDDYTCQHCRKRSDKDMQVHHLDGYNWCIEKRLDDTNGITLCGNCHADFHQKYGKGNNTKEQFEEWIGQPINPAIFEGDISWARKVYCYEQDIIYDSAIDFCKKNNLKTKSNVHSACNFYTNNKIKYSTVKGMHVFWLDEYKQMSDEQIQDYIKIKRRI